MKIVKNSTYITLNNIYYTINIYLLLISLLIIQILNASTLKKIVLMGKVTNSVSGKPLANTNITIQNQNLGTISNEQGNYELLLSPGTYTIIFSYMGYHSRKKVITLSPHSKSVIFNVALEPKVLKGQEVIVTDIAEEPRISRYDLPSAQLANIANPLPDALLSLKTLPGVFSGNDQSRFYNVRGGNYDENLVYLNGVEIYQPLLVRKGIAENPSLVNPDLIQSINLRTGAFPVNYGDMLSSVLDITYREGNPDSMSGVASLSTIKANLTLESVFGRNINWILGMRKINYGYLFHALQTEGDYTPDYKDIQLGITWRLNPHHKIKFFGVYGYSRFKLLPEVWSSLYDSSKEWSFNIYLDGKELFSYQTAALGLQWVHQINKNFQIHSGISSFHQSEREETYVESYSDVSEFDSVRIEPDTIAVPFADQTEMFDNKLTISLVRLFIHGKYRINQQHQFKFGYESKVYLFKDRYHQAVNINTSEGNFPLESIASSNTLRGRGFSAYGEYCWSPNILLSIRTGLRVTEYNFNEEFLVMPRLSLIYRLDERTDLFLVVGRYSQPPLYKEFRSSGGKQTPKLKAQKSTQVTLGVEHQWAGNMSFRVEGYYKRLRDLISYNLWDVRIIYSGRNDAIGYVYGLDAHLRGEFIPDCLSWFSYSYMVAREDLDHDVEKWVPRPSDQRHTLSAYLQDKMVRFPGSRIHIRILFGSGSHYTYKYTAVNEEGKRILKEGRRNALATPHYTRFDIGLSQEFKLFNSVRLTLREEILNVFDHYNVLGYSLLSGTMTEHGLSRRTFNIGMRMEF